MKNGSISEQLKMQEKQIASEKENKFSNSQNSNPSNSQSVNQENKHNFNLPDLGLSSALGLFTPDVSIQEEEQAPVKKKDKKPKRGLGR